MNQRAIPVHIWDAAVRIVQRFYAITAQEKADQATVLDEAERQAIPGRAIPAR